MSVKIPLHKEGWFIRSPAFDEDPRILSPLVAVEKKATRRFDPVTRSMVVDTDPVPKPLYYVTDDGIKVPIPGLYYLAPALLRHGVQLDVEDILGGIPRISDPGEPPSHLRTYQVEAWRAMCKVGHGMVILPTGTGKTEIFLAYAKTLLECTDRSRILVITPTNAIRDEIILRAGKYGMSACSFRERSSRKSADIVVTHPASILSAVRRGSYDGDFTTVIVDEAHHARAMSWAVSLLSTPSLRSVFGFTATLPGNLTAGTVTDIDDSDTAAVLTLIGPPIYMKKYKDMNDFPDFECQRPLLVSLNVGTVPKRLARTNDYITLRKSYILSSSRLEKLSTVLSLLGRANRKVVVVSSTETTVDFLFEKLQKENYGVVRWSSKKFETSVSNATFQYVINSLLKSGMDKELLERINQIAPLTTLLEGDIDIPPLSYTKILFNLGLANVLLVTTLGKEGIDLPDLDSVILFEGSGEIPIVQIVGRIMRPGPVRPIIVNLRDHRGVPGWQSQKREEVLMDYFGCERVSVSYALELASLIGGAK